MSDDPKTTPRIGNVSDLMQLVVLVRKFPACTEIRYDGVLLKCIDGVFQGQPWSTVDENVDRLAADLDALLRRYNGPNELSPAWKDCK